jgi:dephospho-CoA kinase
LLYFRKMIVGITGGIGSGKSLISEMIKVKGYSVFDADKEAKLLYSDSEIQNKLRELFGDIVFKDGKPDKNKLASLVFENKENLEKLNAVIHPGVRKKFEEWKSEQTLKIIFREAAILIESGSYKDCDKIILVTAPVSLRIKRVLKRDQTNEQAVLNRMKNQWKESELIPFAHYIIKNDEEHSLLQQVNNVIKSLEELC